jgi:two-component system response regulator RegA
MILLIDDDTDFRQGLAGALRDDGFAVIECATTEEVPEEGRLHDVHLVITDYQMPGQNGLDFADGYHASHPTTAIVLLTAHWSRHLENEVASRPFLQIRRKPIDYDAMEPFLLDLPRP